MLEEILKTLKEHQGELKTTQKTTQKILKTLISGTFQITKHSPFF